MRRSKEIVVLLALLAGMMVFVLWYVRARRAERRAAPPPAEKVVGPVAPASAPMVDLTQHDKQTIDFSSGKPVVKDSPEERAALARELKELEDATRDVKFEAEPKAPKKP